MNINKCRSTCCVPRKEMDVVNEKGEIIIDGIEYTILVGPCISEFPPHFHVISRGIDIIVPIERITDLQVIKNKKEISIDLLVSFLNVWLKEEHFALSIVSTLDFIIIMWNANNPNKTIKFPEKTKPLARTINKKEYTATIFTNGENKMFGYVYFIKPEEIEDFKNQYPVGSYFKNEMITDITIL